MSLDVLFIWRMSLTAFQRSPGLAQSANRCFMKSLRELFMILLAVRQDFLYSLRSSSFLVALQRRSSRRRVRLALMASGDSHLVMGFDFLCELTFRGATRSNSLVTTLASCSQKSSTLFSGDENSSDSSSLLSNSGQLILERFRNLRVTLTDRRTFAGTDARIIRWSDTKPASESVIPVRGMVLEVARMSSMLSPLVG